MQNPLTIHLISHNHWDREWIFTARYTNRWLPPFFANVFTMLEREPQYRFVLDGQTAIIEDCLSQLSADEVEYYEKQISRFAKEGRLLIGPAYLQPDWGLVSGEALVRNLLIGHKVANKFGPVMKAGWMLDNFGQIGQAPQIYQGFGIDGVFVWRGVDIEVATLTRQGNEARISELLNQQLYDQLRIEDELEEIGEAMSWSRTKKRAGEYLLHYYAGLLQKQQHEKE